MLRLSRRAPTLALAAAIALAMAPDRLRAQDGQFVLRADGEPDRAATRGQRKAGFSLFGLADAAYSAVKTTGRYQTYTCNTNGSFDCGNGLMYPPFISGLLATFTYVDWAWGTPPSEAAKIRAIHPSAADFTPDGFGFNMRYWGNLDGSDNLLPSDRQLGRFLSGLQSTRDNTCADHRKDFLGAGNPLLPGSDCPDTWGPLGWQGRRPVPESDYLLEARANPGTFKFDFWNYPAGEPDPSGRLEGQFGFFQTYGYFSDYSKDEVCGSGAASRGYGKLVKGTPAGQRCGSAVNNAPGKPGYPLGLEVRFDAFSFALPALQDVIYYQATVTNNSAEVYGTGVDYDSLYIGFMPAYYGETQRNMVYHRPDLNAIIHTGNCTHQVTPNGPCNGARTVADLRASDVISTGAGGVGYGPWDQGTASIVLLKSPIGDMRNKLFSRPSSPFSAVAGIPASIRDDTITYSHGHLCGFRACNRHSYQADYKTSPDATQRQFGMISSTDVNTLGALTPSTLGGSPAGQRLWHIFRSADWPAAPAVGPGASDFPQTGGFNRWVPGNTGNAWDWNNDGVQDTLYYDTCSSKTTGFANTYQTACVGLFSDTMPHTGGSDRRWLNGYANVGAVMTVGPISLRAGETVGFTLAATAACCGPAQGDSAAIMKKTLAAIDHYMNFYLGPEPLPRDTIAAVDVVGGSQVNSRVTLRFTETAETARDPFILSQVTKYAQAAPNTPDDYLRKLNPWLIDSLMAYGLDYGRDSSITTNIGTTPSVSGALGNFERLYIFKSCDGGNTFTNNANCSPSAATGGDFATLGWLPYAALERNASGDIANTFTDQNVNGGATYTYVVVGETRGVTLTVQTGDAIDSATTASGTVYFCTANCVTQRMEFAPKLFNTLATSGPNARAIYVPASAMGGTRTASVSVRTVAGPVPPDRVQAAIAANRPAAGTYTIDFYDSVQVVVRDSMDGKGISIKSTRTTVTPFVGSTAGTVQTSTAMGGPGLNGAALIDATSTGTAAYTIRTRTYTVPGMAALVSGANGPVLVTNRLDASATPESFHSSAAFPGFVVGFQETTELAYNQAYGERFADAAGAAISDLVHPFVRTRTASTITGAATEGGLYRITWAAKPFGPGEPFRLNFNDPTSTVSGILASLQAREAATLGAVSDAIAAAIGAGTGAEDLVAVRLPFSVFNESYDRQVTVAMKRRASNVLRLGSGADTMSVTVPEDIWLPGDQLYFLEDVSTDGTDSLRVTFSAYVLGCDPATATRVSCNPLALLSPGASLWITTEPGTVQRILYNPPLRSDQRFELTVQSQSRAADLAQACTSGDADACRAVKADIRNVKAVPNPYVAFSSYVDPRSPTNPIRPMMFTHVPPRGVLRIYTVSGQMVQQLSWTESDLNETGDLLWNLQTREGNTIAGGLYLFMITGLDARGKEIGSHMGKFVIVR